MSLKKALLFSALLHLSIVLLLSETGIPKRTWRGQRPFIAEIIVPSITEKKKPLYGPRHPPSVPVKKKSLPRKKKRPAMKKSFKPAGSIPEEKRDEIRKEKRAPAIPKEIPEVGDIISKKKPSPEEVIPEKEELDQKHVVSTEKGERGTLRIPDKAEKRTEDAKETYPEMDIKEPVAGLENDREETDKTSPLIKGLFNRKMIEDIVKNEIAKSETGTDKDKGRSEVTFSVKDLKYRSYMKKLRERIETVWRYPAEAAMRGIYGDLFIKFTILEDGRLGEVELIRTSGYRELDEAAIRALRKGEPYWPPPGDGGHGRLTVTGHFIYTLYGTYLR